MADSGDSDEPNTVRLSFRTTPSNFDKIMSIAKAKGWLNAQGKPNVSAVLNFVIAQVPRPKARSRRKP